MARDIQLALGTVQFGLAYGIAGRGEPVPEVEVRSILEDAAARGVRTLDTAAAYGDIEARLARLVEGLPFRYVSKIAAIPDDLDPDAAAGFALQSAQLSRARLGDAMRGLMFHRAQDLEGERGQAIWARVAEWCDRQGVGLGASCYTPDDAARLVALRGVALAQLPGNAFDQRIAGTDACLALRGVEVHLRSVFLQGLLLMPPERACTRLPAAREPVQRWHRWAGERGLSPLEAALSIVKSFRAVSTVVVGADNLRQWREIADAWSRAEAIEAPELAVDCADIIDPRHWSLER